MKNKTFVRETLNKFIFHSLGIILLMNFIFYNALGQNQLQQWIIPPYDIRFGATTTAWDYSSTITTGWGAYANMHDPQGNYLFSVFDNEIWDAQGSVIATVATYTWGAYPEISIVPVPGSCTQFYIITPTPTYIIPPGACPHPSYVTYDISTQTLVNPSQPDPEILTGAQNFDDAHTNAMPLAVSKLKSNQTRYLFVSDNSSLFRFTIDANGIGSGLQIPSTHPCAFNSTTQQGEMELYEKSDGTYMVAIIGYDCVSVCYFDAQDNLTSSIGIDYNSLQTHEDAHGLEFSPNGQYLYLAKPQSPYIAYADVTVSTPSWTSLGVSNASDFAISLIELGNDGKLYLAASDRLATIGSPNTPTTPNWTNGAVTVDNNSTALSIPAAGSGPRILPDQIDGEVYWQGAPTLSQECCEFVMTWDQENFTASTGTYTWTPSSNPLNNGVGNSVRVEGVLTIPQGADITIEEMILEFGLNSKVVIEPKGKLKLRGTIFTGNTLCENTWLGVEVLGTGQTGGDPDAADNGQFIMEESATGRSMIEQAYYGVVNGSFDNDLNNAGGYIECTRAIFQDNYNSVTLFSHNYAASGSGGYYCLIENCEFKRNNGLWYPYSVYGPRCFISLYDVSGLDDIVIRSSSTYKNTFFYGETAISCIDTRNIDIDRADFDACKIGISSQQATYTDPTQHNFTNLIFNEFTQAISLYNTTDDVISSCDFNPNQGSQDFNFEGIYLEACNNFNIFDNQFHRVKSGVRIKNALDAGGWVFNNIFGNNTTGNGCWRGVQSYGDNSTVNVKCNIFYNNQAAGDFSTAWFIRNDFGDQGANGPTTSYPAGNEFYRAAGRKDIYSYAGTASAVCTGDNFCYYHHNLTNNPECVPLIYTQVGGNVQPINTSYTKDETSCAEERERVMLLAENDPEVAMELIDEQENPVTKQLWINELVAWYVAAGLNQDAVDYLLLFNNEATNDMLFNIYMSMGIHSAAEDILTDRCAETDDESVAWCDLNTIILDWAQNNETPFDMDSGEETIITDVSETETSSAAQAKAILLLVLGEEGGETPEDTVEERMDMSLYGDGKSFSIYPNPVSEGKTVVTCSGVEIQNAEINIAIYDFAGRKYSEKQYTIDSNNQIILPLGILSSGVYFLELRIADSPPEYLKMIIENQK